MEILNDTLEKLKYPLGKFEYGKSYTPEETQKHIGDIEALPQNLKTITAQLSAADLLRSYRDGGWTALQIIHHLADSHMNAYIRVKLAITEDKPMIKPYDQDSWASLPDSSLPAEISLQILEGLHMKLVSLLRSLTADTLKRTYVHPEYKREFALDEVIALYAWHGKQHLAHLNIILNSGK
jgi:hypothetical protein